MRDRTRDPEPGRIFSRPEVQDTLLSRWKDLHRAGGDLKILRHLLGIDDPDRLSPALIRIVRLLNGSVDSAGLAEGIYPWDDHTKREWALRVLCVCTA